MSRLATSSAPRGPTSRCPARSWSAHPKATASRASRLRGRPRRRAGRGLHRRDRGESHDRRAGRRDAAGADPGGGGASPDEARITLRVGRGGRPGGRAQRDAADPAERPGDRRAQEFRRRLAEGATATFDVVLAAPDGSASRARASAGASRRSSGAISGSTASGRWGYEPILTTRRVADGRIDLGGDARRASPCRCNGALPARGARAGLGETAQTSVSFTVGWSGDQTADTPDLLDMTLDKASYRSGERMDLRLSPRFAGKATLAVVSDKVHEIRSSIVAAEGTTASRSRSGRMGRRRLSRRARAPAARPGRAAHAGALARRCLVRRRPRRPRAAGGAQRAAQIRPRGTLKLPIRVAGLSPGEEARVTVAAVDVGILNLTRY